MSAKVKATLRGIEDAGKGIPEELHGVAMAYIESYARSHQFFTGGDVLAAFREAGIAGSELDWRNRWGAIISRGSRRGWYVKSGRVAPTTRQSHTDSLVQWQSRIYSGEQSLTGVTAKDQLAKIRMEFIEKNLSLSEALWKAYELGFSQNGVGT